MECVERALKSGLRREVAAKAIQNQGMVVDDLWAVTSGQAGVDEFFVDEFLDLSNGDDDNDNIVVEPVPEPEPEPKPKPKQEEEEEEEEEDENEFQHLPKKEQPTGNCNSSKHNFPSLSPTELTVPADDLGDLEWLSHFVEDSFTETEYSLLTYPTGNLPTTQSKDDCTQNRSGSQPHPHPHPPNPCFNPPVPAKARTKRARTGGRVWSLGSPSADTSSTSSSSTSSSTSSSPSSALLIYSHSPAGVGPMGSSSSLASANKPPAAKKQRKRKSGSASDAHAPPPPPRRCSHCHVQKTPQWRTGPLGAKTLCNACGVRFKSGRLLPEYRPACSPTFSSDLHSNNHRKVLEMRRKKETELSESGVASAAGAVQSF